MSQDQLDILKRALQREKLARKAAEKILEEKSRELYQTSQKLENLLSKKSSQLQGVFENIVDAYVVMDINGNVLKFNEAATNLFGYDIENESLNVADLIYKDDVAYAMTSFLELQSNGFFKNYEARIYTKSKEVKWVHINASVVFDKDKNPIAAQGIVRDITDKKASEDKIIESENRLSALVTNLDSGIVLEDENRKIVLTNEKFCELFNIEANPEDLIGMDCSDASEQNKVLFKNPERFLERMRAIDKDKVTVIGDELEMIDGKFLERNYMPIVTKGKSKGFLWTFTDVTLKRNYSKNLEAEKQKYYNIISNMNLGLVEVDMDDRILMTNQSFINMTGYTKKELIGFKGKDFLPIEEDIALSEEKLKERKKDKIDSYELRIKNKKGQLRYWSVSGAPNYNIEGNVIGSIGITFDITEIKNLQLQKESLLSQLGKSNDELQEYAHIVSHDLKSPLRSIDALVSWIKEDNKGKLDETSLQNFDHIGATLEKMEQLISDVLEYSSVGSDNSEKIDIDIDVLIIELIDMLYVPEHISIEVENKLPVLKGDKTKLQQVFQNLISNAVKFIDKPEGTIKINVKSRSDYYEFSIADNGMGIEKKFHDKIFKIFHSLNKSKESTGIGLSIVKKIVDIHEGQIWLESEVGKGTTFYFTIKK